MTFQGKWPSGNFAGFFFALMLAVFLPLSQSAADPNAVFLPLEKLSLNSSAGTFEFTIELADENSERQRGLMFRETMVPTHGMLFDFKKTELVFMWMANTILPLDMIFIRPDGTIAAIRENTVPFSKDIISSGEPVSHVLELNAGMARQINLKPGDRVEHRLFNLAD